MDTNTDTIHMVRFGLPGNGDVIHTSACRYTLKHPNPLRWKWADTIGFDNIDWDVIRRHGLRPCQVCRPDLLRET